MSGGLGKRDLRYAAGGRESAGDSSFCRSSGMVEVNGFERDSMARV